MSGPGRMVKLLISLLVSTADAAADLLRTILGRPRPARCVVLYYHGILAGERSRFAAQMETLLRLARPVGIDHPFPLPEGERFAAVTFDDGLACLRENAFPELARLGIPGAVFVPSAVLGQEPAWDTDPWSPHAPGRLMDGKELASLPGGEVIVGSHGATHRPLSTLSLAELRHELASSKEALESATGRPVLFLSLPYGDNGPQVLREARKAGFLRVFSSAPATTRFHPDEYLIGRTPVTPGDTPFEFRLKVLGAFRWVPAASRAKRALAKLLGPAIRPSSPKERDR